MQNLATNEFQKVKQQIISDIKKLGLDQDTGGLHPLGLIDIEKSRSVLTENITNIRNILTAHIEREKKLSNISESQRKQEADQFRHYFKLWKDNKKTALQKEHILSLTNDSTQKLADYYTHQQQSHTSQQLVHKSSITIKNEKVVKALKEITTRMKHFYEIMSRSRPDLKIDNFCDPMDYESQEGGVKLWYYTTANEVHNVDVICNTVGSVQSVKLTHIPDATDEVFNNQLTQLLRTSQYDRFVDVLVSKFQNLQYYKDYGTTIGEGSVLELRPPVCVSWEIARDIWKYCNRNTNQTSDSNTITEGIDLQTLLPHRPSSHRIASRTYSFYSSDNDQKEMKKYIIRGVTVSRIPFPLGINLDPIFKLLGNQLTFNELFNSCFSTAIEAMSSTYNIEVTCTHPSTLLLRTLLPPFNFLCIQVVVKDDEIDVKMDGEAEPHAARVLRETMSIPIMMHFILDVWPSISK